MFTGIIEETGKVISKRKTGEGYRFKVKARKVLRKLKISDSISVNGVCHTVVKVERDGFEFTSVKETLNKTSMGELKIGDFVNLESSLKAGDKIGGHFVYGHIDDTAIVNSILNVKNNSIKSQNFIFEVKINKKHFPFVVNTGSIAINGVSLTIADISAVRGNYFCIKVSIIPFTYTHTTFRYLKTGDIVNIELDVLGKYVNKILGNN